jgi:hypothetical protein
MRSPGVCVRSNGEECDVKFSGAGVLAFFASLAGAALTAVHAQDAIRPGKWEYTVTMQMPNPPQLPPGVQTPPNAQMSGGGMTVTHTSCLNGNDPIAELRRPQGAPGSSEEQCKVERMQRSGGTINWASSCTTSEATVRTEGTAHYNGGRMEANFTTRTVRANGAPIQAAQHVVGRYVGPCEVR